MLAVRPGWTGWLWNQTQLVQGHGPTALQLELQTFETFLHRPMVVGAENRFHQEGQVFQDRFFRLDAPVVKDFAKFTILNERPNAATDKIPERLERESVRCVRFGDAKFPAQRVRQETFGEQLHHTAHAGK